MHPTPFVCFFFFVLAAAMFCSIGCSEEGPGFANRSGVPAEAADVTLALLTGESNGIDCIQIIDVANDLTRTIELDEDIVRPEHLTRHPAGFFIVASNSGHLWQVESDGTASLFTDETFSGLEGIDANKSGEVTVIDVEGINLFNAGGAFVQTLPHPEGGHWSDSLMVWNGEILLIDDTNGEAHTWSEEGDISLRFLLDSEASVGGADDDGRFYVGGSNGTLTVVQEDDGVPEDLPGFLSGTVRDIAPANENAVYVMTTSDAPGNNSQPEPGGRIYYVTNDGTLAEVMRSSDQKWWDFAVLP
jgi:hypothetical protein